MAQNQYPQKNYEDRSETPKRYELGSFLEGDKLKDHLFDDIAEKIASSFVGKNNYGNPIGVTPTQLRRIFDEVKRFDRVLETDSSKWTEQKPYIQLIKSKVAYTVARAKNKAPKSDASTRAAYDNLYYFISNGIKESIDFEKYHIFVSLFEAVYGFYYEKAPRDGK